MTDTIDFYEATPEEDDNTTEIVGGSPISDNDDSFRYLAHFSHPTTTIDGFEAVTEPDDNGTAIVGGEDVTVGDFPWQAEVTYSA